MSHRVFVSVTLAAFLGVAPSLAQQAASGANMRQGTTVNAMKAVPPSVVTLGGRSLQKSSQSFVGGKTAASPAMIGVGGGKR